jgi:hypothetical protein
MIQYIHPAYLPSNGLVSFALTKEQVRNRNFSAGAASVEEILTSMKYMKRSRIVWIGSVLLNGWTIILNIKHHPI